MEQSVISFFSYSLLASQLINCSVKPGLKGSPIKTNHKNNYDNRININNHIHIDFKMKTLKRGWEHGNHFTLPSAEYWMIDGKSTLVQVVGLYTEIHWI